MTEYNSTGTDKEPSQLPDFQGARGPTTSMSPDATPLDSFNILFNREVWEYLIRETNTYADECLASGRMKSTLKGWKPVTIEEMKVFVALILNMGIIQLTRIKDYWSKHETVNVPFFRSAMARNRFLQIFNTLHVGDARAPGRGNKIQPFIDLLLPRFQQAYTPGREVAIDESMIAFKGRASFKQYVRNKPKPWGIKAYVLADSHSGYLHQLIIYYGKDTEMISIPCLPVLTRVVLTLCQPLYGTSRYGNFSLLMLVIILSMHCHQFSCVLRQLCTITPSFFILEICIVTAFTRALFLLRSCKREGSLSLAQCRPTDGTCQMLSSHNEGREQRRRPVVPSRPIAQELCSV